MDYNKKSIKKNKNFAKLDKYILFIYYFMCAM